VCIYYVESFEYVMGMWISAGFERLLISLDFYKLKFLWMHSSRIAHLIMFCCYLKYMISVMSLAHMKTLQKGLKFTWILFFELFCIFYLKFLHRKKVFELIQIWSSSELDRISANWLLLYLFFKYFAVNDTYIIFPVTLTFIL
jgi:hypothetical protein